MTKRLLVFAGKQKLLNCFNCLRCFDTVFRRPYRYFSIALKVVFSLPDRYKIFTSDKMQFEVNIFRTVSKLLKA